MQISAERKRTNKHQFNFSLIRIGPLTLALADALFYYILRFFVLRIFALIASFQLFYIRVVLFLFYFFFSRHRYAICTHFIIRRVLRMHFCLDDAPRRACCDILLYILYISLRAPHDELPDGERASELTETNTEISFRANAKHTRIPLDGFARQSVAFAKRTD